MSDTGESSKAKTINRFSLGSAAIFQVALAFLAVVLLNFLSCTNHKRFDLSRHTDFSLAETSIQYLQSPAVKERSQPIKIVAVVKQSSPYYLRIKAQLENYRRQSNNAIVVEHIDPLHDRDRLLEFSTTYQRKIATESILIDARDSLEGDEGSDLVKHIRSFPVDALFTEEVDRFNKHYISSWNDEAVITTSLVSAVEGTPRKFYFIVDKARIDEQTKGTPAWKNFQRMLNEQNIELLPIQISSIKKIPDDAEGLAIIGPAFDFDKQEIAVLNEYWDRNSASIFITLDPNAKLKNLKRFLREYGITPLDNRILSTNPLGKTLTAARAFFTQGPEATIGLAHQSTRFDGPSMGLEIQNNNDRLAIRNINPFPLVQAADGWWGESRYTEPNPNFDPREDQGIIEGAANPTPAFISGAVVRGLENNDTTAPLTSRMIVIGNTDFLRPENDREEINQFLNSSINWLAGRQALIGVPPKSVMRQKITIEPKNKSLIDQITLIYLPFGLLLIALIFWNSRRN
ncbi:Gldg family protein [Rubritalea marina]|uniref:Gldg family protein n=1 Tax=Rubritalea marina TaxID=361055 RepID=UPI00036CF2C9|nr:Gldg family protein [Rubritalea marina]